MQFDTVESLEHYLLQNQGLEKMCCWYKDVHKREQQGMTQCWC
jgi:hypothetical protein